MESNIFLAAQPLTAAMFVIGFIIFVLYMVGYLYMINTAHKQQRRQFENDPEMKGYYSRHNMPDSIDYDGIGNQGRFPEIKEPKKRPTKRKAKTKSKMYI
jgi:hypothetical protein